MKKSQQTINASINLKNRDKLPGSKNSPTVKETPEMMVRSLQGIFCKGRYRSWVTSPRE